MRYHIRLRLHYDYQRPVADARHLVRVQPRDLPGIQQLESLLLRIEPETDEDETFDDFYGNHVRAIALRQPHALLDVEMQAYVNVTRAHAPDDISPGINDLRAQLQAQHSLLPDSPWHFLPASVRVPTLHRIVAYAGQTLNPGDSVLATVERLGKRLHRDFKYDAEATEVDTPIAEAFDMRAGVCQDFSHIMIAWLRGLGIPAAYVSGFLRTIPPPCKPRLEGADATHAWVRAWCGEALGWREFDPTNGIFAGNDHITIGYGRDYADIPPIAGVLKTSGAQEAKQSVDVVPLD